MIFLMFRSTHVFGGDMYCQYNHFAPECKYKIVLLGNEFALVCAVKQDGLCGHLTAETVVNQCRESLQF